MDRQTLCWWALHVVAVLPLSQAVMFKIKMVILVVDIRLGFGAGRMVHWVRILTTKRDDLSSSSGTHMLEEESQL